MGSRKGRGKLLVALIVALSLAGLGRAAQAADDRRELEARALFAKGEYAQALDLFAKLFAEKVDPIYLRHIGRCYQQLRQPEKAIDAFREYLRRAHVKPREREEVEGFIRDMQALQATQPAAPPTEPAPVRADTAPSKTAETTPATTSPPVLTTPPAAATPATDGGPSALIATNGAQPAPANDSLTHRWWFWAGIGAVVVGGVATAIVLSSGGGSEKPTCPSGVMCGM
jgi:hypothetical protein